MGGDYLSDYRTSTRRTYPAQLVVIDGVLQVREILSDDELSETVMSFASAQVDGSLGDYFEALNADGSRSLRHARPSPMTSMTGITFTINTDGRLASLSEVSGGRHSFTSTTCGLSALPLPSNQLSPDVARFNITRVFAATGEQPTAVMEMAAAISADGRYVGALQVPVFRGTSWVGRFDRQSGTYGKPLANGHADASRPYLGTSLAAGGRYQSYPGWDNTDDPDSCPGYPYGTPVFFGCPMRAFVVDHATGVRTLVGEPEDLGPILSEDGSTAVVNRVIDGEGRIVLINPLDGSSQIIADSDGSVHVPVAAVSADGMRVAYIGWQRQDDGLRQYSLRLLDRHTGLTRHFDSTDPGASPALSGDGRILAYTAAGASATADLVVLNLESNEEVRIPGVGASRKSLSYTGNRLVFSSASTSLAQGDNNYGTDLFVFDPATRSMTRIAGNGSSTGPQLSGDGRTLAFVSESTNFVAGDTNQWPDVFVADLGLPGDP